MNAPDEMTLCTLEVVVMPNGEILCAGRTVGWVKTLGQFLVPKNATPVEEGEVPSEPDDSARDFDAALVAVVEHFQDCYNTYHTRNGFHFPRSTAGIDAKGARYVRLWLQGGGINGGQRSCAGFVRRSDGAILYSGGWTGPFIAKDDKKRADKDQSTATVRGNIFDSRTWGCIGEFGVKTIR